MPKPSQAFFALILSLFAFDAMAQAAATPYEAPFTVLQEDYVLDARADGTYTLEHFNSKRINNQQGVQASSQMKLPYSTTLQELEVIEAYTLGKDGKRTDVPADKIFVQQRPESAGAPMFDDAKVKNIVFSAVEQGVTLNVRTRLIQKIPLFPGIVSKGLSFPRTTDYKASSITLRAPESMKLYVEAIDLDGGEVPSDRPGMKLWRWALDKPSLHLPEPGSVSPSDFSPRVVVTGFPSYAAAAKAYQDRAKPAAAVTPAIQQLADQITSGVTDRRAQAEALYRWVSKEIRYVGIFLGFGGVVPHAADEIGKARYGDCKDHVTILEALLAAKGIQSSPVLVNSTGSYWLPKVAIAPGMFNHVITYLPEFKLYVDSTVGMAPFGVLPLPELGKQVLVVDDGTGQPAIVSLPLANAQHDRLQVTTKVQVTAEGGIKGESAIVNTGAYELVARQLLSTVPKGAEAMVAGQVLSATGQPGTGRYAFGDAHDLTRAFDYATQFESPSYAQMPGPGAMRVPQGLGSVSGIAGIVRDLAQEKRDFPIGAVGGFKEEVTTLALPESVKITALPKPVVKENAIGKYTSSYAADGTTITVRRTLEFRFTKATLNPDESPLLRELAQAVFRDFQSQILYQ